MTRLRWLIVLLTLTGSSLAQTSTVVTDKFGAVIRGDTLRKEIALVFTGDEFAEGGKHILSTLRKHKVKGSFFLQVILRPCYVPVSYPPKLIAKAITWVPILTNTCFMQTGLNATVY